MKVKLHRRARADLIEIRSYLIRHASAESADRVRRHLQARIRQLGRYPNIGVATTEPDVRVLSPTSYPYRIYFLQADETVIVLHIRHTSRAAPPRSDLTSDGG